MIFLLPSHGTVIQYFTHNTMSGGGYFYSGDNINAVVADIGAKITDSRNPKPSTRGHSKRGR
jgi:hypothetical protein